MAAASASAVEPDPGKTASIQPLPDMTLGTRDAPVNMIEYASPTCPYCARFDREVFPRIKKAYIDTGKVYYVFREMPGDGVALRAAMIARSVDKKRFFDFIHGLFQTQKVWANPTLWNDDSKTLSEKFTPLATIARDQAGMPRDTFDMCLTDEALMRQVVMQAKRGVDEFGVNQTPDIFLNGRKFAGNVGSFESIDDAIRALLETN